MGEMLSRYGKGGRGKRNGGDLKKREFKGDGKVRCRGVQ